MNPPSPASNIYYANLRDTRITNKTHFYTQNTVRASVAIEKQVAKEFIRARSVAFSNIIRAGHSTIILGSTVAGQTTSRSKSLTAHTSRHSGCHVNDSHSSADIV